MKTTYNKLIRDKIPEIIATDGASSCEIRQLSDEAFLPALNAKLQEEVTEYLESENIEELADVDEVIRSILVAKHSSYDDLEKIRTEKKEKRGGFEKRLFLVSTTGNVGNKTSSIKSLADFTALLEREKTVTPYKYSLLRAIIESCRQYPHYVVSSEDNTRKYLPMGLCIMKWLIYYYPFFKDDTSIMMNTNGVPLGFSAEFQKICKYYEDDHGRFSKFRNDIISGSIPSAILQTFQYLVKNIHGAMLNGPICHFGGSDNGKKYSIFRIEKSARNILSVTSYKEIIERCGVFSMPTELWSILTNYGSYIVGSGTIMDKWLDFLVKFNPNTTRDELLVRLSTLPEDERKTDDAMEIYKMAIKKGLVCVWDNETKLVLGDKNTNTGKRNKEQLVVDHMLPFSIWKSNALWNLVPSSDKMNMDKLDKIPSRKLLEMRKYRILECWDMLHKNIELMDRFEKELATDLLKGNLTSNWKEDAFKQLCYLSDYLITECGCAEWLGPKQS